MPGDATAQGAGSGSPPRCLVFDIGAGSARAVLAELTGEAISMTELHRFAEFETRGPDGKEWDIGRLLSGVETGLARAAEAGGVRSIGVDSFGVDFGLLDESGALLPPVRTYRHPRSQRGFERCPVPKERIGDIAGAQVIALNTIFQLCDQAAEEPGTLARARTALMLAPLVSHHLSGVGANELTLARTSGLHDLIRGGWSAELLRGIGVRPDLMAPIVEPGTVLGPLRPGLRLPGLEAAQVVAVASHDTASALLALAPDADAAFLSAGSWNLLGYQTETVALPEGALAAGYGSESGAFGRRMVIRSLPGLFLMRRLRSAWEARTGEVADFADLAARASAVDASVPAIDVADPAFFDPDDMIAAMEGHRPALADPPGADRLAALAAAIYRGIAADIGRNLAILEDLRGARFDALRLGGGGALDATFCGLLARTLGRPVIAGPVEASAAGNAIVQFLALGAIGSLAEGQARIAAAGGIRRFDP